jgi:hypothetical protein
MLLGYNESRLKSSFGKIYGHYNDLDCNYIFSLAHVRNDLFHTLYRTFVSILALTTGNPVYLISNKAHGGCDRSAEDAAYSSVAPDPTFAFVGSLCCLTLDFVFAFCIINTLDKLLTSISYISRLMARSWIVLLSCALRDFFPKPILEVCLDSTFFKELNKVAVYLYTCNVFHDLTAVKDHGHWSIVRRFTLIPLLEHD